MICENCGIDFCYLNRYCSNCKWDRQPERGLTDTEHENLPRIDEITKEFVGGMIHTLDSLINNIVKDEYETKKHLQNEFRKRCSAYAERFDLETGIEYWKIKEIN